MVNLYPPIVDTYMPAFLNTGTCKIYFSLSPYNNKDDIHSAQVTVNYQSSNLTALSATKYPNEIKYCQIQEDKNVKGNKKYYIVIKPKEDLIGEKFAINTFYKIQIRFTDNEAGKELNNFDASWLNQYRDHFSEWSTVCLVRGISDPNLIINGVPETAEDPTIEISSNILKVVGKLSFEDTREQETLKSYQIYLKQNGQVVEKTGIIYSDLINPNAINYGFKTLIKEKDDNNESINWTLVFRITTKNLYTPNDITFKLKYTGAVDDIDFKDLTINASADEELSSAKIEIKFNNFKQNEDDQLWIKRTSIKEGFQKWEYVHKLVDATYEQSKYIWYDFTIENGIFYKYGLEVNRNDVQVAMKENPKTIIVLMDNMFIARDYRQLNIRFNPQISSYQKVINNTTTTTLGSKYPFVSRNGNSDYKQFSISGLISSHMDNKNVFTSRDEFFTVNKFLYDDFNKKHNISEYRDFQYEYYFREKVIEFLCEDTVKILRSPTEGNLLIKLTNVSLTPNQTLGRLLYSFSATAVEIDEYTPENLIKYGVCTEEYDTLLIDEASVLYHSLDEYGTLIVPPQSVDGLSTLVATTFSNKL